jgi:hypothetical protein
MDYVQTTWATFFTFFYASIGVIYGELPQQD